MENVGDEMVKVMAKNDRIEEFNKLVREVMQDSDVQAFIAENREKLTDDDISKSYAKLYEFVREKRKFKLNDPTMIAPGYEPKLVINYHSIDVIYEETEELLAKKAEEKLRRRVKSVGVSKDVREAKLENYIRTQEREQALREALLFIDSYTENPKDFYQGMYLQGSFGVGKTYLLGIIANELAEYGIDSSLVHYPTLLDEMKRSFKDNSTGEKIDAIKKVPVLMLDDIGAEAMTSWGRDDVLGVILQYRMQEQLPTFFSSNLSMNELENEHFTVSQKGEVEPMKAKRIMQRIRYLAKEIELIGEDRRLNK